MKKTGKRIGALFIAFILVFALFCSLASGDDDSGSSGSKDKGGKTATCNYCHGTGKVKGETCPCCGGSGKTYDNYFNDILD